VGQCFWFASAIPIPLPNGSDEHPILIQIHCRLVLASPIAGPASFTKPPTPGLSDVSPAQPHNFHQVFAVQAITLPQKYREHERRSHIRRTQHTQDTFSTPAGTFLVSSRADLTARVPQGGPSSRSLGRVFPYKTVMIGMIPLLGCPTDFPRRSQRFADLLSVVRRAVSASVPFSSKISSRILPNLRSKLHLGHRSSSRRRGFKRAELLQQSGDNWPQTRLDPRIVNRCND